jgi:hypothetical protein
MIPTWVRIEVFQTIKAAQTRIHNADELGMRAQNALRIAHRNL